MVAVQHERRIVDHVTQHGPCVGDDGDAVLAYLGHEPVRAQAADNAIRVPPTTAPPRLTNSADSWCSGVKQYTVSLRPRAAVEAVPKADTAQR